MSFAIISAAFLQGLFGSVHCLGMCGPFVLLLHSRNGSGIISNLIYNIGRSISYSTIGFLLGMVGFGSNKYFYADLGLYLGSSLVLILGIGYIFPFFPKFFNQGSPAFITKWVSGFLKRINNVKILSFLIGIVSGLLPCGLLYPAYSLSLLTSHPVSGALVMFAFSLGTYPMIIGLGLSGQKVLQMFQNRQYKVFLGILLVIIAISTIFNRINLKPEEGEECHTETDSGSKEE
ncbi:sulfite exporter TauE/SafE family protein [Leptospira sp. GIMC2001]|uniref:sulfite exporter TauE/SafE family protein n=1 Tax=Leptospira sp. GIMC2001 TaxID=1513297 RepID=UPI0004A5C4E6|nr:sulfite exporter TauE/SafE family protein [Leptospira sp. GIMC2001]AID56182.1 heavy-metal-associated domain and membrane-bounded cytochrome biogenesis cycZ-like domain protein [Leptospira sp. GIMC2001]WCL48949.1 sulfite exporter TauE/SafE family protein [Leptospira sp. GIMC2001]